MTRPPAMNCLQQQAKFAGREARLPVGELKGRRQVVSSSQRTKARRRRATARPEPESQGSKPSRKVGWKTSSDAPVSATRRHLTRLSPNPEETPAPANASLKPNWLAPNRNFMKSLGEIPPLPMIALQFAADLRARRIIVASSRYSKGSRFASADRVEQISADSLGRSIEFIKAGRASAGTKCPFLSSWAAGRARNPARFGQARTRTRHRQGRSTQKTREPPPSRSREWRAIPRRSQDAGWVSE